MADEVRIIRWCDICPTATPGHRDEATHRFYGTLGVRHNGATRVLDTCDLHAGPVLAVVEALGDAGRPYRPGVPAPEQPARVSRTATLADPLPPPRRACPLCGFTSTMRGGPTAGLSQHLYQEHNAKPIRQPKRCPDCRQQVDTPAGMVGHRTRKHGYDHIGALAARVTP